MSENDLRQMAVMKQRMQKQQSIEILDELELLSKFVMEPNLTNYGYDKDKFKHNNKTWFATNTNSTDALILRRLSENIQMLNNFRVAEMIKVRVKDPESGKIFEVDQPIYNNRFDNLLDIFMDNIAAINSSSAGRHASVLKLMRSIITKQDQTLEDKSSGKRGSFFSFGKGGKGDGGD